ncbi:hypothetical protein SLEP1_g43921 [Rubroshorea leprosula]|uniref:Transcription elongation factor SPT5 n=1 Tax=Rubroshorea leprosula TaxID=152421 RepID=A0AAV5LEM1_9ROSI|nr:hypothetical protein SLEP1_g43921 [Rubroshorea leprosula]
MARRRRDEDEEFEDDYEEESGQLMEDDMEEKERVGSSRKRRRSAFIDDVAEEDDEEDEDGDEDKDFGGRRQKSKRWGSQFLDLEAQVDSDEEEEEYDGEDGADFIVDGRADLLYDEDGGRRIQCRPLLPQEDEQEDVEALERSIQARYARSSHVEYHEETTEVEQQALLPSVKDTKLWMVKCLMGHERETAFCLMQKYIDKGSELQIRSAIALDHIKNCIYIEADKEAHVREACKGMRNIFLKKIELVPLKEMRDVLSVKSKAIDLSRDTWVRMKTGTYRGDLAKVVDVDNVLRRVTVKLIPRIDLQALAKKLEGQEVPKKKALVPPRLMNINEARELHIRVERAKDPLTGDYFEKIDGMFFKDGFLFKTLSMKSIIAENINPTFDELEKFRKPGYNGDDGEAGFSTLFANKKKGCFMKGDLVVVVKGDLKDLEGWVEKVEEEIVHIRPKLKDIAKTLAVNANELCKLFKAGNHVKVISGIMEGATGTVVRVEKNVLTILSDTKSEYIHVFADDVVKSSEVTTAPTKIGDYELRDLILLDNNSFGVIIHVESEAFKVLMGVPERQKVALVKLREIKCKIEKKFNVQDKYGNTVSGKDIVKILDGPCKGKQGPVEHIYKGVLFIHDRYHLEHSGLLCAKSNFCCIVGGSRANGSRNGDSFSRFGFSKFLPHIPPSPKRYSWGAPPYDSGGKHGGGRRAHDSLVGSRVKICQGPYKGCHGCVVDVKGQSIRVELESQMRIVTVDRKIISDNVVSTHYRDASRYGMGSETPLHPSRTPLHPCTTPMRDPGAAPIHDGMRTPMSDRAWNPYTPMNSPRNNWEDGNPASWGTSPLYQPGGPQTFEAPIPGSGWVSPPSGNYSEAGTPRDSSSACVAANAPSPFLPSTPGDLPMTPSLASHLPGTTGGQPMTPGTGGLDVMSPVIGTENEGPWFMPDVLVNVHRSGQETVGVILEVLPDGSCKLALGSSGNGETVIALPNEVNVTQPRKNDKIKVMTGSLRGATGKLIGVDGTDGIVRIDDNLEVKILDLVTLGKLP